MLKFFLSLITRLLTSPYILGSLILLALGGGYIAVRNWIDSRAEAKQDTEIIRENEEHLGCWAQQSAKSLIRFRLHRDGKFMYKLVNYPAKDTVTISGKYIIATASGNRRTDHYPRLVATGNTGDTIINHYIAYITPYDAEALDNGYDKMVLNAVGSLDTAGLVFFRIKKIE